MAEGREEPQDGLVLRLFEIREERTSWRSGALVSPIWTRMLIFLSRSQSGRVPFHDAQLLLPRPGNLAPLHGEVDVVAAWVPRDDLELRSEDRVHRRGIGTTLLGGADRHFLLLASSIVLTRGVPRHRRVVLGARIADEDELRHVELQLLAERLRGERLVGGAQYAY